MSRLNAALSNIDRPKTRLLVLILAGVFGLGMGLSAAAASVEGFPEPGLGMGELAGPTVDAIPPLPDPGTYPIQLVIDDDSAEGAFGFLGANARQFLWLNRFVDPGNFALEEIWVLFPAGTDVAPGEAIQLVVFVDPDGDPTNGADILATFDDVVQVADGVTFSVYTVPPVVKSTPGDVLIGVVNRYFDTGVDPPPTLPAAFDSTATQNQSYFALWTGDAPDPPDLATATSISLFAGAAEGNFMIRGFGTTEAVIIPSVGGAGLAALATLLALVGVFVIFRQIRVG
jgi:hypothetical protein